ncbi:MAG: TetR/AcrR family transcriptional regulator [Bryobacteraceae bacterium]
MGVVERRAREKEALRAKILEATSRLMVKEGFESVSIRRIAEQIEYSPATIYLYFKDKAELIDAICQELFGQMIEVLGAAVAREIDPLKRFRVGLRAYVEFGISHPNHYLAVFGAPEHGRENASPTDHFEAHRLGVEAFDILRQIIRGCISQGVLPPGDVETTSHAAWMCMHGITSLMITTYGGPFPVFPNMGPAHRNHLIDAALDLLVAGLQNCTLSPIPVA